jgi:hypothetical protein
MQSNVTVLNNKIDAFDVDNSPKAKVKLSLCLTNQALRRKATLCILVNHCRSI